MTINGISSSFSYSVECTSPEGRLVVTLLSNEQQQQDIDQQMLSDARKQFVHQAAVEVAAMHEAADDARFGAWVQAGVGIAGAGLQGFALYAEGRIDLPFLKPEAQCKGWEVVRSIGAGLSSGLAAPLNTYLGDSAVEDDHADAKQAGSAAQLAQWEIDDRNEAIDGSREDQQHAVDWLGRALESDAASNNAILSNMA